MHMADALISPSVGITMCAISTAAIAYSVNSIKKDELCEKKIPIIGVMGALIFAAQMINFTIPATGSSGHIGGGILLAAMIGAFPALLSMSVILIIQCLFFADGGLLALGCNIFNLGVVPCLIVYPLIFKPIIENGITKNRITAASIFAVIIGLQIGAFCVVLETLASGITELPFSEFLFLMLPIHLAIGVAEGIATAAVLCFAYKARPEIMESSLNKMPIASNVLIRNTIATLAVVALLVGGALSLLASSNPDGLEWAVEKVAGTEELEIKNHFIESLAEIQEKIAFLPDYNFKNSEEGGLGTTVSGISGGLITFLFAAAATFLISTAKRRRLVN